MTPSGLANERQCIFEMLVASVRPQGRRLSTSVIIISPVREPQTHAPLLCAHRLHVDKSGTGCNIENLPPDLVASEAASCLSQPHKYYICAVTCVCSGFWCVLSITKSYSAFFPRFGRRGFLTAKLQRSLQIIFRNPWTSRVQKQIHLHYHSTICLRCFKKTNSGVAVCTTSINKE
jgi:hypothetical protein